MKNFRKEFPVLEQYIYLNTASSGLLPEKVLQFRRGHDLEFFNKGSVFRENADKLLSETRENLGGFFDCPAENIALLPNFSLGLNLLLEGIPKKSKILLLKGDYPDINLAVESRDFEICYAEIDENLEENIEKTIAQNKPEYFAFSIVQWISGIKIDLNFLKKLKQNHPELVLIADGTQYCGTEKFNFENSAIDVLAASTYKWLNAGYGNAFFLFKKAVQDKFSPKALGYGSTVGKYKETKDNFIGKLEPGHLDTLNFGGLKIALDLQTEIGQQNIQTQIEMLSQKAKTEFEKLGLLEEKVVKRKTHSSIFNLKGDERLFQKLRQNNIVCIPRGNGIRVGFHYFNTESELNFLLEILNRNT